MKSEEAKKGTKVTWNSPQGRVEGEVVKKVKKEKKVQKVKMCENVSQNT